MDVFTVTSEALDIVEVLAADVALRPYGPHALDVPRDGDDVLADGDCLLGGVVFNGAVRFLGELVHHVGADSLKGAKLHEP